MTLFIYMDIKIRGDNDTIVANHDDFTLTRKLEIKPTTGAQPEITGAAVQVLLTDRTLPLLSCATFPAKDSIIST